MTVIAVGQFSATQDTTQNLERVGPLDGPFATTVVHLHDAHGVRGTARRYRCVPIDSGGTT